MNTTKTPDLPVQVIQTDGGPPLAVVPLPVLVALVGLARKGAAEAGGQGWSPQRGGGAQFVRDFLRDYRVNNADGVERQLQSLLSDADMPSALVASAGRHQPAFVPEDDDDEDAADRAAYLEARAHEEETLPHAVVKRLVAGEHPLKVFREYRGLTQAELAEKAGTKPAYLSQIETGRRDGGRKLLGRLARALGVELADLMVV